MTRFIHTTPIRFSPSVQPTSQATTDYARRSPAQAGVDSPHREAIDEVARDLGVADNEGMNLKEAVEHLTGPSEAASFDPTKYKVTENSEGVLETPEDARVELHIPKELDNETLKANAREMGQTLAAESKQVVDKLKGAAESASKFKPEKYKMTENSEGLLETPSDAEIELQAPPELELRQMFGKSKKKSSEADRDRYIVTESPDGMPVTREGARAEEEMIAMQTSGATAKAEFRKQHRYDVAETSEGLPESAEQARSELDFANKMHDAAEDRHKKARKHLHFVPEAGQPQQDL